MWPASKLEPSTRTSTPLRGGADYLRLPASRSSIVSNTVARPRPAAAGRRSCGLWQPDSRCPRRRIATAGARASRTLTSTLETARTASEERFETYLSEHWYQFAYEPDLGSVKRPD